MKFRYLILIFFYCFCAATVVQAQSPEEQAIVEELEKQGVSQAEVEKRLLERGYDLKKIDSNNPAQLLELQNATEQIIAEIKSEQKEKNKAQNARKNDVPKTNSDSQQVPKDTLVGASGAVEIEAKYQEKTDNGIYGHQLYSKGSIRFYKKSEYTNTPDDYILGPGDEVTVSIWGRSEANFSQVINNEGFVKFSEIPRISLTGLKLKDARELVKSKLSRRMSFTNETFDLNVVATRNINVFITGEVVNVGSFNMSAVNTAVNALAASGGPTALGSVRNIKIVSNQNTNKTLDLYKFLSDPVSTRELYLFEGDYIVVPVMGKVVEIKGAINRPYKYELLPNESLMDLINYAGGTKVNALKKNVIITRYENDGKVVVNADISRPNNLKLKNGDVVEILEIEENLENAIFVEGSVENAGEFELTPRMKLADLMKKVLLADDAILDVAYLIRLNDDKKTVRWEVLNVADAIANPSSNSNVALNPGDKLTIRGKATFTEINEFEIRGAVNREGAYQLDTKGNLKVSDAIFLASGLKPGATDFGYIIRNTPGGLSPDYITLDIKNIVDNPNLESNINVEPGDIIQVYSKNEYVDDTYVTVEGAVRQADKFKYDESLTLTDVLRLAGGITIEGASNNIDIFRLEFKNNNKTRTLVAKGSVDENLNTTSGNIVLEPFDHIVVRKAPEFERKREIFINGEVKFPGKYYLLDDNFTAADLIKEAGGLTEEAFTNGATLYRSTDEVGFIIIDLESALKNPSKPSNVILQLNDSLYIPKINNLVSVRGAVNKSSAFNDAISSSSKINFTYDSGKSAKHYIEKSGGFQENADKNSVTVKYPNGELKKTTKFLFFRNYPEVVPGSTISVEFKKSKEEKGEGDKEPIDWGSVLTDSVAQATTILSLILLLQAVD